MTFCGRGAAGRCGLNGFISSSQRLSKLSFILAGKQLYCPFKLILELFINSVLRRTRRRWRMRSRDLSVCIASRLWPGPPRNWRSIRGSGRRFLFSQRLDRPWDPCRLLSNGYRAFFPQCWFGRGVKLTTVLHLVPKLRMHGAILPTPPYFFMSWCFIKHRDNFSFQIKLD
jgi:hypothetical protein